MSKENKDKIYMDKKEKRAKEAQEHTNYMQSHYEFEINKCIKNTKFYDKSTTLNSKLQNGHIKIRVDDLDSVSALFKYKQGKTCVLNFASYRHAGGNFINGSRAQEECLCLESFLYNVLKEKEDFYIFNSKNLNNCLYTNRALYSPSVIFKHNNKIDKFDVLTCAAPNYSAASKSIEKEDNSKALRERIQFIIKILIDNNVETAILGAFGCGVFQQNPKEVATIFKEEINKYYKNKKINIIFAIPSGNNNNLDSFKEIFKKEIKSE
jgi:uncharacterized protein (TIGR02452 family)